MKTEGYTIGNADITIVCQSPKLAPHLDKMKEIISNACNTNEQRINIKATTTEKMGYTGRQEGISSHAVVFLTKSELENTQC
jgi:2-C-methyl-D-erythritol 2,4-cyclodiphosphate synthase